MTMNVTRKSDVHRSAQRTRTEFSPLMLLGQLAVAYILCFALDSTSTSHRRARRLQQQRYGR